MTDTRRTAVVICPGRGTYNASELGYLGRTFPDRAMLSGFDAARAAQGQETLSALDGAERFLVSKHSRGDNASGLIFAASYGDFLAIDRALVDIVAVTGNSMGWYTALACAGALGPGEAFHLANTMGSLMQRTLIGGQLVHPFMDEDWFPRAERREALLDLARQITSRDGHILHLSINLGGMLVMAGDDAGLKAFERAVETVQGRFPMRLANHAAFHTPLMEPVAAQGRHALANLPVMQPELPLIDGRGMTWWPGSTDTADLWDYTLTEQVTRTFDFTRAVTVAAREFAPDMFIVTGPGSTLGGAVAQSLILAAWRSMGSKADFKREQAARPLLLSMGVPEQRRIIQKD